MENKRYLDKVLGYMVKGTKIDYGNKRVIFSHFSFIFPYILSIYVPTYSFEIYCKNQFGLTEEEIKYVFKQYKEIIKEKIINGQ